MNQTNEGKAKATRQCWECLRHRLVCDFTHPHCKKCQKSGKECPGYNDQKPLQWIANGKVTSRQRKKRIIPRVHGSAPEASQAPIPGIHADHLTLSAFVVSDTSYSNTEPSVLLPASHCCSSKDERPVGFVIEHCDDKVLRDHVNSTAVGIETVQKLFAVGGRSRIEEVVAKGLHNEAAKLVRSDENPLVALEGLLTFMRMHDLPNYDYLSNNTSEVVQAVNYFNVRIHPDLEAAGQLAPNPAIIQFPLDALHVLPPAAHHTLVCLALNHYINSLPSGVNGAVVITTKSKLYQHRGEALRALGQYVARDKTRCSDLTIASIMMFLSLEVRSSTTGNWRLHADGMLKVVNFRGGFKSLMKQSPYLTSTLVVYILQVLLLLTTTVRANSLSMVTISNTTSPAWDQISFDGTPEENIDHIAEMYSLVFPYTLCPPSLFYEVIRINTLRHEASTPALERDTSFGYTGTAYDLLGRIEVFTPQDWAQPGDFYDEKLLVATIYQCAIALYCIMSLQSLNILPNTLEMKSKRLTYGARLLELTKTALQSPRLVNFMVWPLTVAGMEAGYRDSATQYCIETQFEMLSHRLGTWSPLGARLMLKRYWGKFERGWDVCFDQPCVVVS